MDGILVQMTDRAWTTSAVRAAAEYAAANDTWIVLARMLPTSSPRWCGDLARSYKLTETEQRDLAQYEQIAAEFGVNLVVRVVEVESSDFDLGVVRAADDLGVDKVLVKIPEATLRPARLRHIHQLNALLGNHHHQLVMMPA
ncbi:MAG: hypothetical protein JNL42_12670 [Anaerolineae bacterium]|nr:hypothetical protein [Anaerolineae bacterium]